MDKLQSAKEEIDRVNLEVQAAERDYDLNRAAELKYGTLLELQKQLTKAEEALQQKVQLPLLLVLQHLQTGIDLRNGPLQMHFESYAKMLLLLQVHHKLGPVMLRMRLDASIVHVKERLSLQCCALAVVSSTCSEMLAKAARVALHAKGET